MVSAACDTRNRAVTSRGTSGEGRWRSEASLSGRLRIMQRGKKPRARIQATATDHSRINRNRRAPSMQNRYERQLAGTVAPVRAHNQSDAAGKGTSPRDGQKAASPPATGARHWPATPPQMALSEMTAWPLSRRRQNESIIEEEARLARRKQAAPGIELERPGSVCRCRSYIDRSDGACATASMHHLTSTGAAICAGQAGWEEAPGREPHEAVKAISSGPLGLVEAWRAGLPSNSIALTRTDEIEQLTERQP